MDILRCNRQAFAKPGLQRIRHMSLLKRTGHSSLLLLILVVSVGLVPSTLAASKYKVLHSFAGDNRGGNLNAGVVLDARGNLYGVTGGGGAYGGGVVFKLKRRPDGHWTERVLHSLNPTTDGSYPNGRLMLDASGQLYGTTQGGGAYGAGTVFGLTPSPMGWTFNLLYTFCSQPDCSDGANPWPGMVMDDAGNLYGNAFNVFELTPGWGGWTESVLYNFCAKDNCKDGWAPYAGMIFDKKGNLYGTTNGGGGYHLGTVYRLKHLADGTWKETVLHSFGDPNVPNEGKIPGLDSLVMDSGGSLYGTTGQGGHYRCFGSGCGTVFRLTRKPDGHWTETVLYSFQVPTGYGPAGGLVMDRAGNFYGTTVGGGGECGCGVIYKLSPNPDGTYTYTVLHNFTGMDGGQPEANMILDDQGNLYGTAKLGPYWGGVVFEFTP